MSVYVIGPDGKPHGPFRDRQAAWKFGAERWPSLNCEDRDENPNAWEIRISTRDQATVPIELR